MGLATGQNVRDYCNLAASATDEQLTSHLNAAVRELKEWVGDVKYAEAVAAQAGDQIKIDLIEAEAFLTYHFAIDYLGLKHTEAGFASQGQIGEGQFNYLGPAQIKKLRQNAWDRARKAAEPYMGSSTHFHLGQAGVADET